MLFSEHIRKILQSKVFKMLVKGAKNWYLYPLLALLSLSKHYLELNSMRFELTFRQNIINTLAAISLSLSLSLFKNRHMAKKNYGKYCC